MKRLATRVGVRGFLAAPGQKPFALRLEERAKALGRVPFAHHGLALARDLEVDERDLDRLEAEPVAEQPAVDLGLRPMKLAMVRRHPVERAAVGLHLVDPARFGAVAVGPATHAQTAML